MKSHELKLIKCIIYFIKQNEMWFDGDNYYVLKQWLIKDDRIGEQLLYSSSRSRLTLPGPNDLYLLISFVTHTNT